MGSSCCKAKPKRSFNAPGDKEKGDLVLAKEEKAAIQESEDGMITVAMPKAVEQMEEEEKHMEEIMKGNSEVEETPEDRRKKMLQGYSTLHSAAGAGNVEVLEGAIDSGDFELECTAKDGQTPLIIASKEGQLKTVELLVTKKANMEAVKLPKKGEKEGAASSGHTPLHFAAFNKHVDTVRFLCKSKANIEAKANEGTPIVWATLNQAHEVMGVLADNAANLNFKLEKKDEKTGESEGWAPIHLATKSTDAKAIQILAEKKADLELQMKNGSTALALAGMLDKFDTCRTLLDIKADVEAKAEGIPLLLRASHAGQSELIKILVEYKADINFATDEGMTAIHVSTQLGNLEALTALVDAKANLEAKNESKLTPFQTAVLYKNTETATFLIDKKADIEKKFEAGDSVMHIAVSQSLEDMTKALVERSCSVNAVNDAGMTPLILVCASIEKRSVDANEKLIRLLGEAKADPLVKMTGEFGPFGVTGKTAVQILRRSKDKEGALELQEVMKKYSPREFTIAARAQAAAEELAEKAEVKRKEFMEKQKAKS